MKITVLMENSTINNSLACESGLSLYIEFGGKRILFDTGASGLFISNAMKLGVDLSLVDYAVISHGHYDHAGGLMDFLEINGNAKVYMKREAAGEYYFGKDGVDCRYVGIDKQVFIRHSQRINFLSGEVELIPGCVIITDIITSPEYQNMNLHLYMLEKDGLAKDNFKHELVLAFIDNDGITAITGCSHNGIVNLVETVKGRFPGLPVKAVAGGFHLMGSAPDELGCGEGFLDMLAEKLNGCDQVYACHCTGAKATELLRERLGAKLSAMITGMSVSL